MKRKSSRRFKALVGDVSEHVSEQGVGDGAKLEVPTAYLEKNQNRTTCIL